MNIRAIRGYAPRARREFIQAMTDRAAFYGLTADKIEPVVEQGDVALIAGREHPRAVAKKRKQLEDRIKRHGPDWSKAFGQTMEALAYTWFNRLVAIRFMELHGYLDHGYRVLSARILTTDNTDGTDNKSNSSSSVKSALSVVTLPEILEHAEHVELPGLKKETVIDLKLAGNRESELYRLLLTAQCNALNTAMPFLFEKIDDETELLLPDNLLHSDSLIRKLVSEIDEEDWREVEIIGWLYQFYISEKKDEVIGKVVASEDIPAATQLFTPNWIVKYLVQNTLGRLWIEHHPNSPLKAKMDYYIEPAEQTAEVQEQLRKIIEERLSAHSTTDNTDSTDGKEETKTSSSLSVSSVSSVVNSCSLNPEKLTLLDPACGSGHILVEAYEVFKAIYQERGYRAKDIPALILQKNLFGLEIDDRAAQLAAFALMMKARADDRNIFNKASGGSDAPVIQPNILAFEESQGMNAADITHALNSPILKEKMPPSEYLIEEIEDTNTPLFTKKTLAEKGHVSQADIASLLELFENAKTFGSLIQVPPNLAAKLPEIEQRLKDVLKHGDLTHAPAHVLKPLLQQARLLARQYDAVVANPPYMGSKYYTPLLKEFANDSYGDSKSDTCTAFIERGVAFTSPTGFLGEITMQSWMFLSSFERIRRRLINDHSILCMAHLGPHAFPQIGGQVVQVTAFVLTPTRLTHYRGSYKRLVDGQSSEKEEHFDKARTFTPSNAGFERVPGSPVAYWVSDAFMAAFSLTPASTEFFSDGVTKTGNNAHYLRLWWEVSVSDARSPDVYRFHAKGGTARKFYGNRDTLVRWDGSSRTHYQHDHIARITPEYLWQREGITWTDITGGVNSFRILLVGDIAATAGPAIFCKTERVSLLHFLGFLNSNVAEQMLNICNPTLHVNPQEVLRLPFKADLPEKVAHNTARLIDIAKADWELSETSSDFQIPTVLRHETPTIQQAQVAADNESLSNRAITKGLEKENNLLFIKAYGLQDELSPEVPDAQITLYHPDRAEDIKRLLSYAIGCIMGRYSLDKPGLIYAHSSNQDFDPSQYKTFRADDDGILPLLETDWGIRDDATNRFVEFIGAAWPTTNNTNQHESEDSSIRGHSCYSWLEENLKFIADSLGPTTGEQPRDSIRRYLATRFYKHHLSMYKKRPIYWLFTSGKRRAFQCLVYLHRYHEGTLPRMRTEYVIPLQGQIAARIEQLEGDKATATSTSHRRKLQKEQDELKKQQAELSTFEEKLKHAADQKINLDLDDGVKVNYGKFGDLLAEVRAITGGREEE